MVCPLSKPIILICERAAKLEALLASFRGGSAGAFRGLARRTTAARRATFIIPAVDGFGIVVRGLWRLGMFVGHYPLLLFKGLIRQRHSGTAAREQFADRHKTVADFRLWRA